MYRRFDSILIGLVGMGMVFTVLLGIKEDMSTASALNSALILAVMLTHRTTHVGGMS